MFNVYIVVLSFQFKSFNRPVKLAHITTLFKSVELHDEKFPRNPWKPPFVVHRIPENCKGEKASDHNKLPTENREWKL